MPEGLVMKYFMLKPRAKSKDDLHALASQQAMLRYAEAIRGLDPGLADELRTWAVRETTRQKEL